MLRNNLKRSFIIILVLLQVVFFPRIGFTEGTTDTPSSDTPTTTTTGPAEPTGADSETFVYNPDTGLWENDYYTWDPVTKQTAPKPGTVDYSYNPDTGKWDTTEWRYDAPSGKYVPNVTETTTAPTGAAAATSTSSPQPLAASSLSSEGPSSPSNVNTTTSSTGIDTRYVRLLIPHP